MDATLWCIYLPFPLRVFGWLFRSILANQPNGFAPLVVCLYISLEQNKRSVSQMLQFFDSQIIR